MGTGRRGESERGVRRALGWALQCRQAAGHGVRRDGSPAFPTRDLMASKSCGLGAIFCAEPLAATQDCDEGKQKALVFRSGSKGGMDHYQQLGTHPQPLPGAPS